MDSRTALSCSVATLTAVNLTAVTLTVVTFSFQNIYASSDSNFDSTKAPAKTRLARAKRAPGFVDEGLCGVKF